MIDCIKRYFLLSDKKEGNSMEFSKIFIALENSRREVLKESNYALDLIAMMKDGNLGDFKNEKEVLEELQSTLEIILKVAER